MFYFPDAGLEANGRAFGFPPFDFACALPGAPAYDPASRESKVESRESKFALPS
tara:strand:+ start:270639 stop:270800 length:162 start_codon:yes stop_codon:yes gene_type:complete